MEEDLKILKVEYVRNHWLDLLQIWNLSLNQNCKLIAMKVTSNWRRPQNTTTTKISQEPLFGSSSAFKLKPRGQKQNWILVLRRRPPDIKVEGTKQKLNVASYEDDHRGYSEEILEENSSVALLSPACFYIFIHLVL